MAGAEVNQAPEADLCRLRKSSRKGLLIGTYEHDAFGSQW